MAYKHAEVVKAWLDGKIVQMWIAGKWTDMRNADQQNVVHVFHVDDAYRIKPEPVIVRYRRYLYQYYNTSPRVGTYSETSGCTEAGIANMCGFVKWIDTEWREYVVNE